MTFNARGYPGFAVLRLGYSVLM